MRHAVTILAGTSLLCLLGALAPGAAGPSTQAPAPEGHLTNVTRLTFDGDNGEAYFSWDDRRLIWQSNRGGHACDKIWMMNADGADKHRVSTATGAHTCSYFLPGDQKIVYASTAHQGTACPPKADLPAGSRSNYVWQLYPYDIYVAEADGSNPRRITDNPGYDAEPVLSRDGKIVFGSQRAGDFDIYTMNADGSNVRRLTDRVGYDGGPWWSPDGTKIVWRAWHPETDEEKALWNECMRGNFIVSVPLDLWVMDADGSNKRLLLRNGATNWAPSWHPDGKRIVFSSNMDDWRPEIKKYGGNFELYLINADGTGRERLTRNSTFDSFPMFSRDGKKLVFGSNRDAKNPRQTDIFIADWVE
ncbi:MAG: PD40 domain-containing protein [Deltaproteobacteria bacterium]|nr:PD40 domain-containing protein [Deltaproteobacteria bacterium]